MSKTKKYYCPVCQQSYDTRLHATQCPEQHGYPEPHKYKRGQLVLITNKQAQGRRAVVINFAYSKPCWKSRKPHTLVYLLGLIPPEKPITVTTATQDELRLAKS